MDAKSNLREQDYFYVEGWQFYALEFRYYLLDTINVFNMAQID